MKWNGGEWCGVRQRAGHCPFIAADRLRVDAVQGGEAGGGSGAFVVPRACHGCVRAAWRELGEGGRFGRALRCVGRRRPPRARGWGVRTAGIPRLGGSVAGGEAKGGEGERGGHAAGLLRRRHGDATAIHLLTETRKTRASVASSAPPPSRLKRRRRGAQCGPGG